LSPTLTAVGQVLRDLTGYTAGATTLAEITIPQVWQALSDPSPDLVAGCRYADRQHLLDDTRAVRDALGALVHGPLAGLFDDPPPSTLTGGPRSSPCRCPAWNLSATRRSASPCCA
jgi:hypothetical protein